MSPRGPLEAGEEIDPAAAEKLQERVDLRCVGGCGTDEWVGCTKVRMGSGLGEKGCCWTEDAGRMQ